MTGDTRAYGKVVEQTNPLTTGAMWFVWSMANGVKTPSFCYDAIDSMTHSRALKIVELDHTAKLALTAQFKEDQRRTTIPLSLLDVAAKMWPAPIL